MSEVGVDRNDALPFVGCHHRAKSAAAPPHPNKVDLPAPGLVEDAQAVRLVTKPKTLHRKPLTNGHFGPMSGGFHDKVRS